MHELGLAAEVVRMATEASAGRRIRRVQVEVGALALVLPDALRFCFDLATEGTEAEGAALEVLRVPGEGRCRACDARVVMERPIARCACGGDELEWLSGDGFCLKEVEVF